jgi:hypothetical protein
MIQVVSTRIKRSSRKALGVSSLTYGLAKSVGIVLLRDTRQTAHSTGRTRANDNPFAFLCYRIT